MRRLEKLSESFWPKWKKKSESLKLILKTTDPIAPIEAIQQPELTAINAKIQNVEQTIEKLNKLRSN
ncbi:hypothetical protein [Chitinophaga pinensis]|uniref:Uncharacterized protein n=1 Tax=Chitinophaga pinensis TaxID=79329 RepID=A0A5C6LPJ9_9BACT|nr:hypothetical protein [Chitinophaga pinensis]TWV99062.1 hypothetical protein FEF09_18585 [Chitinophaga pinensis]